MHSIHWRVPVWAHKGGSHTLCSKDKDSLAERQVCREKPPCTWRSDVKRRFSHVDAHGYSIAVDCLVDVTALACARADIPGEQNMASWPCTTGRKTKQQWTIAMTSNPESLTDALSQDNQSIDKNWPMRSQETNVQRNPSVGVCVHCRQGISWTAGVTAHTVICTA